MGDLHAFTFEFDVDDPDFLKLQLSWLRSRKNRLDCAVGALYQHLAEFADFAGITVSYSGNKSLHFHLVFDTGLAVTRLGLNAAVDVRRGLMSHWDTLHTIVLVTFGLPANISADTSLRAPEAYRRIPNGTRVLGSGRHILGIPAGTFVPQVTLWEKWRDRAGQGADALFFTPEPFFSSQTSGRSPGGSQGYALNHPKKSSSSFNKVLTPEEMEYCEAKLRTFYPGYPSFESLGFESGHWVARFRNSPADQNPSSIMRGDYNRIMLVGKGAAGLTPRDLPYSLAIMIKGWIAEFRRPKAAEWEDVDWTVDPIRTTPPRPHEVAFSEAATDHEATSRAIRKVIRTAALSNACSLISAPEGIKKTTSLFNDHRRVQGAIHVQTGAAVSMYAFGDYKTAEQKCADFNAVQESKRRPGSKSEYWGIVLPSFSKSYEEACLKLGVEALSPEDAANAGYPNLWSAVTAIQPIVLDALKARHRAMWSQINGRRPVFFTVHDVAHRWKLTTPTRVMWAERFWIGRMDDHEHVRSCRRSTSLGLLVHDEVTADNLVALHRAEVLDWVDGLRASDPKLWGGHRGGLSCQIKSFRSYVTATPFPVVAGAVCSVSFNEARQITSLGRVEWDDVVTQWSGEYGHPEPEAEATDIYTARMNQRWRIASKGWWRGVAERVVMLTTEAVPTEVARRIGQEWTITELETPQLARDFVDTYPQRGVTGGRLINVVKKYRDAHGSSSRTIISNRVKALSDTITHMAARGSNEFIGQDLAQTMTFLTPDEVERLEALNAWTGRDDLIRLRHIDQFNQTAGRNLGFRKRGDVRHDLLVSHRLLECLMGDVLGRSRYNFRLHLTRDQRYAIRVKAA